MRLHPLGDENQGIVHVIGPQLGLTQPGMTIVCGDSHTATHGAFGALAFGIGTSEVEHVLATQTLPQARPKTMAVNVTGRLAPGVTAKDLVLALIAQVGTGGGRGHIVEYRGEAIRDLSMEGRMTVANMSIEWGAKAGMIAPDETTFAYLKGRPNAPQGAEWDAAVANWRTLPTDEGATFDAEVTLDAGRVTPFVTWGTNPGQGVPLGSAVPDPEEFVTEPERAAARRALEYMDLTPGTPLRDLAVDIVFVGSCTNGRLEDLRVAADVLRGRRVADGVRMLVVPGSAAVREAGRGGGAGQGLQRRRRRVALRRLLDVPGMNPDTLAPGERSRLDLQPQLRGPAGQGWAYPPGVPAGRRRHRRGRPAGRPRRPVEGRAESMDKFTTHTGTAVPLRAIQRGHRPDHPRRVPQAGDPDRFRGRAVQRVAGRSVIRAQPARRSRRASILVAGPDFGTGSSREHAVWALRD